MKKYNETDVPHLFRPDQENAIKKAATGAFMVAENDGYDGGKGRGAMPKEIYPCGSVKTKDWNATRPMRDVRTSVHNNRDTRNAMD